MAKNCKVIRGGRLPDVTTRSALSQNILSEDCRIIEVGQAGLDASSVQGGAYAVGSGDPGKIEPGYRADIVFVDPASINWMPPNVPANQLGLAEDEAAREDPMALTLAARNIGAAPKKGVGDFCVGRSRQPIAAPYVQ